MTTPEKLRRRQLKIGLVLILLAIFTVAQGIYFNVRQADQQKCLRENFVALSHALHVRATLSTRESLANRSVLTAFSRAAAHASSTQTPQEQAKDRKELIDVLVNYQTEVSRIQEIRKNNPVPPYPAGTCEG